MYLSPTSKLGYLSFNQQMTEGILYPHCRPLNLFITDIGGQNTMFMHLEKGDR